MFGLTNKQSKPPQNGVASIPESRAGTQEPIRPFSDELAARFAEMGKRQDELTARCAELEKQLEMEKSTNALTKRDLAEFRDRHQVETMGLQQTVETVLSCQDATDRTLANTAVSTNDLAAKLSKLSATVQGVWHQADTNGDAIDALIPRIVAVEKAVSKAGKSEPHLLDRIAQNEVTVACLKVQVEDHEHQLKSVATANSSNCENGSSHDSDSMPQVSDLYREDGTVD